MTFYTLRSAAEKVGVSHETIRTRLANLSKSGVQLDTLRLESGNQTIISETVLPLLRERKPEIENNLESNEFDS